MSWSRAFAQQAHSDLQVYTLLSISPVPSCHRLHYLQMWLEKLCKSAIARNPEFTESDLYSHNVIARVLPALLRSALAGQGFAGTSPQKEIQRICREVDLLHPQITAGGRRQENLEYPWEQPRGTYHVPAKTVFRVTRDLYRKSGKAMLAAAQNATLELNTEWK